MEKQNVPNTWKFSEILTILKPNKDETDPNSYRPISLSNVDYKIFTKILAKRLRDIIPDIINEDQYGFVKNRKLADPIRNILNILNHATEKKSKVLILKLDFCKAFDSIDHKYLNRLCEECNMGGKVCKVIKELYSENKATILVNGTQTRQININRGTKQGCPLSPALFSLAIEPLANLVRNNPVIKGYKMGKEDIKINLYADDVMIILGEVEESLQSLVKTVKDFGKTSGLTINLGKSEILHKNLTWEELKKVQNIMGVKLGKKKMKYLGVDIPKNINNIIQMNYNHLWKNISKQIITWGKKFRDISTRLKIYKMKILPKFLFLFQTLPVNIPTNLLKKWDNSMKQWVVGGNKNRIANFLYYSKQEMGSWGAPSLGIYYEASQLARLLEFELEGSKKWVQTEKEANNWQRGTLLGERIDRKDLKNLKAGPCFSML
uniref:Reverse transcriptase domain-containing protein n=1 Tax=Anolis carolinensis TaxID=28377 RepID=A0A803TDI1_ANOCA